MMKWKKKMPMIVFAAALVAVTAVSAQSNGMSSSSVMLSSASESAIFGAGPNCSEVAGMTGALAIAALSPCSIVCGTLAFYSLVSLGIMGC
jgi:hypothetical protein